MNSKKTVKLLPHQENAFQVIKSRIDQNEVTTSIQICTGGGKTLLFTKVITDLGFSRRIVVFPTLSLIDQYMKDYVNKKRYKIDKPVYYICTKPGKDSSVDIKEDLEVYEKIKNYVTDPDDLKETLTSDTWICVTTYRSFPKVLSSVDYADIIILDEAHRLDTACKEILDTHSDNFGHLIEFSATLKRPDHEIHYNFPLSDAIEQNMCKDYEIHAFLDLHSRKRNFLRNLERICRKTGNYHVMVFTMFSEDCSRSENYGNVVKFLEKYGEKARQKGWWMEGITGSTSMKDRRRILKEFDQRGADEMSILVSCKTIGEGIDTGSCNAIVFYDSLQSKIDIIQRIGRVVRAYKENGCILPKNMQRPGTVIIPCYINDEEYQKFETPADQDNYLREAINENGDFSTILNVLSAIRQTDPEMYRLCLDYPRLNKIAEKRGKTLTHVKGDLLQAIAEASGTDVEEIRNLTEDCEDDEQILETLAESLQTRINVTSEDDEEGVIYGEEFEENDPIQLLVSGDEDAQYDILSDKKSPTKSSEKDEEDSEEATEVSRKSRKKLFVHSNPDFKVEWEIDEESFVDKMSAQLKFKINTGRSRNAEAECLERIESWVSENPEKKPRPNGKHISEEEKYLGQLLSKQKQFRREGKSTQFWPRVWERMESLGWTIERDAETECLEKIESWVSENPGKKPRSSGKNRSEEEKYLGGVLSNQKTYKKIGSTGFWPRVWVRMEQLGWTEKDPEIECLERIESWVFENPGKRPRSNGKNISDEEKYLGQMFSKQKQFRREGKSTRFWPRVWARMEQLGWTEERDAETECLEMIESWVSENPGKRPLNCGKDISDEEKYLGQMFWRQKQYKKKNDTRFWIRVWARMEQLGWTEERDAETECLEMIESWVSENPGKQPRSGGKNRSKEEKYLGLMISRQKRIRREGKSTQFWPRVWAIMEQLGWTDERDAETKCLEKIDSWVSENPGKRPRGKSKNLSDEEKYLGLVIGLQKQYRKKGKNNMVWYKVWERMKQLGWVSDEDSPGPSNAPSKSSSQTSENMVEDFFQSPEENMELLSTYTVSAIKEICKRLGISGVSRITNTNKEDFVEKITAKYSE